MKSAAWILALMIAASSCAAQVVCDNTNCVLERNFSSAATPVEPSSVIKAIGHALAGTRAFVWPLHGVVESEADEGQHVGATGQCFGRGRATCWGGVLEAHGLTPRSNVVGGEVDGMGTGMMEPGDYRVGLQVLMGKSNRPGKDGYPPFVPGPAELQAAIDIVPMDWATQDIRVRAAINIGALELCTQTCIRLPSGGTVSFDGYGAEATMRFDWRTGYLGFWNRAHELFAVNMSHGGLRVSTVPCPASVIIATGPIRSALECIPVNDGGFVPVYR